MITTSLCVWTAVHLNIPPSNQKYAQFWRKLYWLGIGLFAPEMVAYTAWYQRLATTKGLKQIEKAAGQKPGESWIKKVCIGFIEANCLNRTPVKSQAARGSQHQVHLAEMNGP